MIDMHDRSDGWKIIYLVGLMGFWDREFGGFDSSSCFERLGYLKIYL